jgi:hypothetical protein
MVAIALMKEVFRATARFENGGKAVPGKICAKQVRITLQAV